MIEAATFAVREIELYERRVVLRLPFRFGVVTLTECPQAFVRARIEFANGRGAWGAAAELMISKWFDKNQQLSNEDNFRQLRDMLVLARQAYLSDTAYGTAFGHFARHYDEHLNAAADRGCNALLANFGPALIDRAVLDAVCRAREVSFQAAMRANLAGIAAQRWQFTPFDFGRFLSALRPTGRIEARHTVGMLDAITAADLVERVDDGLPETLEEVLQAYGHRYFKLKVSGDLPADLARLERIAAVLDRLPEPYFVSLDGNEQFSDAQALAELMQSIRTGQNLSRLWDAILFVEQPIARDLAATIDLRAVNLGKPVIIDESDGEIDSFLQAREHGYNGVSSKSCKGLYKSLLNAVRCATWNKREGQQRYFMSAEDLTTQPGLSVQQDLALVDLLGIGHVERNGHHYVNGMAALPAAEQEAFLHAHPDLYERSHGAVRLKIAGGSLALGSLECVGYASAAMPDFGAMTRLS